MSKDFTQTAQHRLVRCIASPVLARDLSGTPPTVVVTAGCDPLRDDGARYAERLRAASIDVRHLDYPTLAHGFLALDSLAAVPAARVAEAESLELFARVLRGAAAGIDA